jgi:class 3 adenylate cyclase/YHS domain-containing protein
MRDGERGVEQGSEAQARVVFVIADLAGYTALTEAHGGDEAATIVARYRRLAEESLADGARIVEQVGDQLLIVSADARAAIITANRLRAAVGDEPHFLAVRVGIADGPTVQRDGRYFGSALNLTARLAARAACDEILCTADVARACSGVDGVTFRDVGPQRFKNVPEPVAVTTVVSERAGHHAGALDPVCWMHLDPATAPARLPFRDKTYYFCSLVCAQAFAKNPENYETSSA